MAKSNINSKKGFTIIEVVLVLAIAGLIFLMVFVALPALQRSQRDTQRRNDMSRVDTSLVQYQTNHTTGANITSLPGAGDWTGNADFTVEGGTCESSTACSFIRQYMNSGSGNIQNNQFTDPDGEYYSLVITGNWADPTYTPATVSKTVTRNNEDYTSTLTVDGNRGTITGDKAFDAYVIYVIPGGQCDGADVVPSAARHFAIMYRLEGAGVYCMDDQ